LTFGETVHYHPVQLRPELRPYTIYVDGISKSLAATGVRVGWAFGPHRIIDKMKSILGHVGAWSPKPEQIATGLYMQNDEQVDTYLVWIRSEVEKRLQGFYEGFQQLKNEGFTVDAIAPQAAIYLTVQVELRGRNTPDGEHISTAEQATAYLLNEAKLAIVPFYAFGSSRESNWYRLSVGTASMSDVSGAISKLREALLKLS
jgi:aspartate aminotransferase